MNIPHRCMMVETARRVITVRYPEHYPTEPHVLSYHPCECGQEVRVEAVMMESYPEQGYHVPGQLQQFNYHTNYALANHLGQNYQYPPPSNPAYEDIDPEDEDIDSEDEGDVDSEDEEDVDSEGEEDENVTRDHRDQIIQYDHHRADWLSHNNLPRRANLLGPVLDNLLVDSENDSEDDEDDGDAEHYQRDQMNYEGPHRVHRSSYNDQPRRPNLLGSVIQNWLVDPEYDLEDEPIENQDEYNHPTMPREYWANDYFNNDDDNDEPER